MQSRIHEGQWGGQVKPTIDKGPKLFGFRLFSSHTAGAPLPLPYNTGPSLSYNTAKCSPPPSHTIQQHPSSPPVVFTNLWCFCLSVQYFTENNIFLRTSTCAISLAGLKILQYCVYPQATASDQGIPRGYPVPWPLTILSACPPVQLNLLGISSNASSMGIIFISHPVYPVYPVSLDVINVFATCVLTCVYKQARRASVSTASFWPFWACPAVLISTNNVYTRKDQTGVFVQHLPLFDTICCKVCTYVCSSPCCP